MLINDLRKLGLKKYEAEAYVTLIKLGEATAREISEYSGVPRPKVYDVLKSLAEMGFVEVHPGNPTRFRAMDPQDVLGRLESEILETSKRVFKQLKVLSKEYGNLEQPVWIAKGDWAVTAKVKKLLENAKVEIYLEIIDLNFFEKIKGFLEECKRKKNVEVSGIYWNFKNFSPRFPRFLDIMTIDVDSIPESLRRDSYVCYRLNVGAKLKKKRTTYQPTVVIDVDEGYNIKVFREADKLTAVISSYPMTALWHKCAVKRIREELQSHTPFERASS